MSSSTGKSFGGFKHFGKASIAITWAVAIYQFISVLIAPFVYVIGNQWESNESPQSPFGWVLIVFSLAFAVLILLIMGLQNNKPFLILPHLILWGLYVTIFVIYSLSWLFSKRGSYILMSIFIIVFFVALVLIECRCFLELHKRSKKVSDTKKPIMTDRSAPVMTYASPY